MYHTIHIARRMNEVSQLAVVTDPVAPVGAETTSFGAKGEGLEV